MRNPFRRDLVLLHAPAIYDFRTHPRFLGPLADAVPSTAIFEMYPIGMTSLAAFLERNHYNVELINLAYLMLHDPAFDAAALIRSIDAPVVGIDLHWLPHAQGALAVADLVKRAHPDARVLMGGLSSSYYHDELIRHPSVDFVLRGDSTEEPARQLLQALREERPLDGVENLTWKRADGTVVVNPLTFVPGDLDYVDVPAYRYLLSSMFKYRSLSHLVPCLEWLRYPTTVLLGARGCNEDCAICGGSRSAYRAVCNRTRPAYRSAEKLADDVRTIGTFSRAPIFMVHDPRMGGLARARKFFGLVKQIDPSNEMIFELYYPGDADFFQTIARSVRHWGLEITLESPDEDERRTNGKFPWPNAVFESTVEHALANGCRTVDVFFMVGLAHQTRAGALRIADYAERLVTRFGADQRLRPFVAPLGPFIDPGSRAFEHPELGYHVNCRSLEDHRRAFTHEGWHEILSYETDGMTRDEIVQATYDVAERLNDLKRAHQLIDEATYRGVERRLHAARETFEVMRHGQTVAPSEAVNHGTIFGDDELKWQASPRFRVTGALLAGLAAGLVREIGYTLARAVGRYDVAPVRATR
jgi:B12-binding domain/radical SAM domain protein